MAVLESEVRSTSLFSVFPFLSQPNILMSRKGRNSRFRKRQEDGNRDRDREWEEEEKARKMK